MLRIELIEDSTRFSEDNINFARMLYEAMFVSEGITPICVVGHQDQEDYYLHWHMVYLNDTGEDFGHRLEAGREL